jgi:hypothetical protein
MLPWLKQSQDASSSEPVQTVEREPDEDGDSYDPLESAADDLLFAIEHKDSKAVAEALRAAFSLCDSEPHEEGEHE